MLIGAACCDHLCDGLNNCAHSAVIRGLGRNRRVKAPCHDGGGVCLCIKYRELRSHGLYRSLLSLSGERHEYSRAADGAVEALYKSSLGADVEVGDHALPVSGSVLPAGGIGNLYVRNRNVSVLLSAVGVQELTGNINDGLSVPVHAESGLGLYYCNGGRFQVLLGSQCAEFVCVLGSDNDRHSLLGFGDSKLGAVQTVVLLRNCVEVDLQTVRKLADGNGNAACAEVVAALDELCRLGISE